MYKHDEYLNKIYTWFYNAVIDGVEDWQIDDTKSLYDRRTELNCIEDAITHAKQELYDVRL